MIILITGATDGLGKAVAKDLAEKGHTLILHGRKPERGENLINEIKAQTPNADLRYYNADFAELSQIKGLAKEILANEKQLDILINNAGLGIEPSRRESIDGNELLWQVNYLGTYILSKMLRPLLKKSTPSRIVNVASAGQASPNFNDINQVKNWSGMQAYCQSKLAQIMLSTELADDYIKDGITFNSLHPASMMPTKIVQFPMDTVAEGVEAVTRLVENENLADVTGKYFFKSVAQRADIEAHDTKLRKQLIDLSEKMTGI
ncbi:MAG: SDR family NAD(P)-dependent oxidoreductase [Marinifilaceae bacterium]|jgi:NAD(P)-dependent dehydrogenase (short-subunit alcohol dehydrogenase family)|nr:SDR family NAD(P)-dependent oxidoreductase [Marinifilaceae bacterium]